MAKLDRAKQDEIIMSPYNYINKVPSKYHKTLALAFNHWLGVPEEKITEIGEILQILHTASLLIDDIQDDSEYRYGVPVAHHVYGIGMTINSASYALNVALKKVLVLNHSMAVDIFCEAVLEVHRGQGMELYWRDNFISPTEEEYIEMIKQKASNFFVLAVQLLQLFSDNKIDCVGIAILIGLYYGIRDDYCNLFNREVLKNLADDTIKREHKKDITPDSDITDGKFTLPIIHALKYSDIAKEIFYILKQRTKDLNEINKCITLLKQAGSATYTEGVLRRLEADIYREIERLGGNPILTSLMKELENWKQND